MIEAEVAATANGKPSRARIAARWKEWCKAKFRTRTDRDIRRLMALTSAPDPKAALEAERAKSREGMGRKSRADQRERVSPRARPVPVEPVEPGQSSFNPVTGEGMTEDESTLLADVERLLKRGVSEAFRNGLTDLLTRDWPDQKAA